MTLEARKSPCSDARFAIVSSGRGLCYLDNSRALALSTNGRIAVVATCAMPVVDELIIVGHEPRPTEECDPQTAGDRALKGGLRRLDLIFAADPAVPTRTVQQRTKPPAWARRVSVRVRDAGDRAAFAHPASPGR